MNYGTRDPNLPQGANFHYKTFEVTAQALKLKLHWVGGDQWGFPGTGFDVDSLEVLAWIMIWTAIMQRRLRFESWSAGTCNTHLPRFPTDIS